MSLKDRINKLDISQSEKDCILRELGQLETAYEMKTYDLNMNLHGELDSMLAINKALADACVALAQIPIIMMNPGEQG